MSFFADNRRPRLAVEGLTGQEPPLKRFCSALGGYPALGEVSLGAGGSLGLAANPISVSAYSTSLLGADGRPRPLLNGLDAQMLAASGLPNSLGSLGTLGSTGSLGLLGMPSTGLFTMGASALNPLSILHANPCLSSGGIPLPLPNTRSKTKLCKHFIENRCMFKGLCNFAHSIEELKKMPDDGDLEGKALLERYKAKVEAEKQSTGQDASTAGGAQSKTKLCKHFIEGTCELKEGCNFAHSIEELKKLPEDSDVAEKALLELYKAKAVPAPVPMPAPSIGELAQEPSQTTPHADAAIPTKTMLCKQYIVGNCKLNDECSFAHSIRELARLPAEEDVAGMVLLELYQSKMEVRKPEQAETLASGAAAVTEGAVKSSAADLQTTQKLESSSNLTVDEKMVDKSVRFLKTRMCKHFIVGACKYGKNCTYAHAIEELKPPADIVDKTKPTSSTPPQPVQSAQEVDAKKSEGLTQSKQDNQTLAKTKPCRFFSQGTCYFGAACSFSHNDESLGTSSIAVEGSSEINASHKTRLCNMWEKDKGCTFGNKCHFAHGIEELHQRTGPITPSNNKMMYGALESEAFARSLPSSVPYPYTITDTNWRAYQGPEEGIYGLGRAVETPHLRGLFQDYGQREQAGSLTSLPSLGREVNVRRGPNIFSGHPSWPTRFNTPLSLVPSFLGYFSEIEKP